MMFRPAHPRVMNYRPRFNPQEHSQWRTHSEPRAFYGKPRFRSTPPHISQNSNLEHWCETCDRGFPTAKNLEEHKLQHQKCNIDGCQFVAHPNVITKHIQMQHSSGLYKKISNLSNPEEIKKWREERKKNFPTRSNIEKKKAELKEKIDRGEKMGLKQGQRLRDSKPGNKRKLGSKNKNQNSQNDFKKKKICNETNKTEDNHKSVNLRNTIKYLPPADERNQIRPFAGIQGLMLDTEVKDEVEETNSNLLIDDDDNDIVAKDSHGSCNATEPVLCGALVSLVCQYGSSDDEQENNSKQATTKFKDINKDKNYITENNIIPETPSTCDNNVINDDDSDSGPEEATVLKIDEENDNENSKKETQKNVRNQKLEKNYNKHVHLKRKQKPKPPSTLLQKLLFKEMQHERNIVLQCVRYIVKNNYFDK